ncbi:unnamed protein product, partial [Urochloa humidicola]
MSHFRFFFMFLYFQYEEFTHGVGICTQGPMFHAVILLSVTIGRERGTESNI